MCWAEVAGTVAAMVLSKKDSTQTTTVTAPAATDTGEAALSAAEDARKKKSLAQGYQSTIATSGTGVSDSASTNKKTLLGS